MSKKYYTLYVNAPLQPIDRWDIFEDPLDEFLQKENIGEVTGGGTFLKDGSKTILSCDIDFCIYEYSEEKYQKILQFLDKIGLPKGSSITYDDKNNPEKPLKIDIGKLEWAILDLNGVDLPDEIYEKCNPDDLISDIIEKLSSENTGNYYSYSIGKTHTSLFFYGNDFEKIKNILEVFQKTHPLAEKSIIRKIP